MNQCNRLLMLSTYLLLIQKHKSLSIAILRSQVECFKDESSLRNLNCSSRKTVQLQPCPQRSLMASEVVTPQRSLILLSLFWKRKLGLEPNLAPAAKMSGKESWGKGGHCVKVYYAALLTFQKCSVYQFHNSLVVLSVCFNIEVGLCKILEASL